MRTSNKVLLIAVAAILNLVMAFVVVMGLTARDLFEEHGRTALSAAGCCRAVEAIRGVETGHGKANVVITVEYDHR